MSLTDKMLRRIGASRKTPAKSFQDRDEFEIAALKNRAKSETLLDVWQDIPASSVDNWSPRAALAAELLRDVKSVADIGCGAMTLERYLVNARYVPVDCVRRDERTVVVDLNREPTPVLHTDAAALLGVVEYIHDVPKLLRELAASYRITLITYNCSDLLENHANAANIWVNSYSSSELEAEFTKAGLTIEDKRQLGTQMLWLLSSRLGAGPDFQKAFTSHYNRDIQLSQYQCQVIGGAIRSRAPGCRLLIFGAGNDSSLWLSLNADGETHFIESDENWIRRAREATPNISIQLLPAHGLTVASSANLSRDDLANFPPVAELSSRCWDVIVVDGPPGYSPTDPGRAISIFWAATLALESTHVFIDDYDREIEQKFSDLLLKPRDTASLVIPSSDRSSYRKMFWSMGASVRVSHLPAVLSVATPDYVRQWRFCIDSQLTYCKRNNFDHHVIDPTDSALHPKWAKLDIAIGLLEKGRDVFLIDADAEIAASCPPFTDVLAEFPTHDIFFARGISGRPNSGVMLLRGGPSSNATRLLQQCLAKRLEPVPTEDFVTSEGENGHIIWLLKQGIFASTSREIDRNWNCTLPDEAPSAFVRHYTNSLRDRYPVSSYR